MLIAVAFLISCPFNVLTPKGSSNELVLRADKGWDLAGAYVNPDEGAATIHTTDKLATLKIPSTCSIVIERVRAEKDSDKPQP